MRGRAPQPDPREPLGLRGPAETGRPLDTGDAVRLGRPAVADDVGAQMTRSSGKSTYQVKPHVGSSET